MGEADEGLAFARRYGLSSASFVSDPARALYAAFALKRGRAGQLFGVRVMVRGVSALLRGHGLGIPKGDTLQMPGVFLIRNGHVLRSFFHTTAADRPDYAALSIPPE